jgi:hypothetical protein
METRNSTRPNWSCIHYPSFVLENWSVSISRLRGEGLWLIQLCQKCRTEQVLHLPIRPENRQRSELRNVVFSLRPWTIHKEPVSSLKYTVFRILPSWILHVRSPSLTSADNCRGTRSREAKRLRRKLWCRRNKINCDCKVSNFFLLQKN